MEINYSPSLIDMILTDKQMTDAILITLNTQIIYRKPDVFILRITDIITGRKYLTSYIKCVQINK